MKETPCLILIVTSSVSGNIGRVYEAMGHGALDAVNTPTLGPNGNVEGAASLLQKINNLGKLTGATPPRGVRLAESSTSLPPVVPAPNSPPCPLVLIGASTGGPKVIAQILGALPANLTSCLIVVQASSTPPSPRASSRWLREHSAPARRDDLSRRPPPVGPRPRRANKRPSDHEPRPDPQLHPRPARTPATALRWTSSSKASPGAGPSRAWPSS